MNGFSDVTLKLLEDSAVCLVEHAYSESILESSMRTVQLFYRFLEDKNLVFDNPARRLQIPKANVLFGTVLTESEVQRMLAVPDLTRPRGRPGPGLAGNPLLDRHSRRRGRGLDRLRRGPGPRHGDA